MRPHDLSLLRTAARPHLHPDGHRVAFDVTSIDVENDRYVREVWVWNDTARRFTTGPGDSQAKWSPDGSQLAFLRAPEGETPQLAAMPANGGEAQILTDLPLGVTEFTWSPHGGQLAVVGGSWHSEWADLDDDERARRPRRITHAAYRWDNRGWLHDRRRHVWLVDPSGQHTPERLTDRTDDEWAPAWSPDGRHVAMLTMHDPHRRLSPGATIVEVAVHGGGHRVRHENGAWTSLTYAPDGGLVAVGAADPTSLPGLTSLWSIGDGEPVDVTGHLDRSVWSFLLAPEMAQPAWLEDGYLTGLEDSGRVHVVRIDASGAAEPVVGGDRFVTGFGAGDDPSRIVFTASSPDRPSELYELTEQGERHLTELNDEFAGAAPPIAPDHFRVVSDGVEIDAWVYLPAGDEPTPVLLNIHGGPASQYGFSFFDEFQVYAGHGHGVVACNPRGSSGRGLDFVRAVTGPGWGEIDVADVTAVLDAALDRHPRLDPDRVGVMGGSYGGFLTAWLLTRTDRFASAVVERALLSWESFSGTSDIAPTFSERYLGAAPPAGRDVLAAASPLTFADRITTPTLIIHSEDDFRCPIEQAEQLFMALMRGGVDVELLRFPGESHELSRSGAPRHRLERFEGILDWHDRHLGHAAPG